MIKQFFYILFLFIGLTACDLKPSNNKIFVAPIDFTRIDAYPLLPECENLSDRKEQQNCFYLQLSNRINTLLVKEDIQLTKSLKDTIFIKIQVSDQGKLSVTNLFSKSSSKKELAYLHQIIYNKIIRLPKLKPAIKAGIPVTTEFTLPVVFE